MSEKDKVIDIALDEVGYVEKKSNSNLDSKTGNAGSGNYTKYARDLDNINFYNGPKNGYAWCDVFVDWCFYKAFGKERALELLCQPKKSTGAGCGFSMNFYKAHNQFHTSPKAGDQIFFTDGTSIYHTGLVYKVDSSRVYTVEGNTSDVSYVDGNGGKVCKKSYPLGASYIRGYGRPNYGDSSSSSSSSNSESKETSNNKIDEDGLWGTDTTKKAQKVFGTTVDGIVSDQRIEYKSKNPGLVETFEWKNNPSGYSELIKAIQKKVGATQDGWIGTDTIKKMQKWLGTVQDGCISYPSDMVKAFQKWLNKQ